MDISKQDQKEVTSDEQLIWLYLQGQNEHLETLLGRYLQPIYNFVFHYVHTAAAAEDVTQEACIKIWKNISRFNQNYKFKTWAFTIAKNTALDYLKKKNLAALPDEDSFLPEPLFTRQILPEEAIIKMQDAGLVRHAVAQLPGKYQRVLLLYYTSGLNFREISEQLNESIDTIKTRHRRAVIYLKSIIGR